MFGISLFDSGFWEIEAVTTEIRYRVELEMMSMCQFVNVNVSRTFIQRTVC